MPPSTVERYSLLLRRIHRLKQLVLVKEIWYLDADVKGSGEDAKI